MQFTKQELLTALVEDTWVIPVDPKGNLPDPGKPLVPVCVCMCVCLCICMLCPVQKCVHAFFLPGILGC